MSNSSKKSTIKVRMASMDNQLELIKKRLALSDVKSHCGNYFSVSFALISTDVCLPYDLYINSSLLDEREKFVKIFKAGDFITKKDLRDFKIKYYQIYVPEFQREIYLADLCSLNGNAEFEQILVIRKAAINHLETLFENKDKILSQELLTETIEGCKVTVQQMIEVLKEKNIDSLQDLIGSLSFHDFYTYDHSVNVSMYCVLLYKAVYPEAKQEDIITAGLSGLLHDIGKVNISTTILNSTQKKISVEAFEEIKKHPQYGFDLLKETQLDYKTGVDPFVVRRVVLEHHENFDGTGYPNKIGGKHIHTIARICAIADFFDAITTKRSYQDPLPVSEALALMARYVGIKLDPELFKTFTGLTDNFIKSKTSRLKLTEDFDSCQPHNNECFCSAPETITPENFGDIILMGRDPAQFKEWLALNRKQIKFRKAS
jgi:HD-GYP domain-containing protein (c-di-GMP phosphodiesterase class II)